MAKSTSIEVEERFKSVLTEQKRLKKKLDEFNKRYELITENANDFIAIVDRDLIYEYINEEFHRKHLGYRKDELIGLKVYNLIHPNDIKRVFEYYKQSVKKGEGKIELRVRHKDGHYIWVEVKGKAFTDISGEIKSLLVSRDITERKEMEGKLKESEEKYRLISESANDLIRVLDDRFEFEYINENVHKRLLGYSKEDLLGQTHLPFLHPEDRRHAIRSTVKNLRRGNGSYEARFKNKFGNYRWFEFAGKYFFDSKGGKKILSIARDINERKIAEQKLKESYKDVKFYKNLFMHDIANIFSSLNLSIELHDLYMVDLVKNEKTIKESLNILKEQIDRGSKLILNIKKLTDLEEEEIKLDSINVNEILEETIRFLKKSFHDKEINIVLENKAGNVYVLANELLRDVFENILINAIKYTNKKLVEIHIRTTLEGDFMKIEFTDNGIGIEDDLKEKIFNRGYTTKKKGKGMGLGLFLVKNLLKKYKGKIWVEDRIRGDYTKGSKFVILLQKY